MHLFQFDDQVVDLRQEFVAAGMRTLCDERGRVVGQSLIARHTGPTPNLAIRQQGKSAQIAALARVPKVTEQVLEPKL